MVAKPTSAEIDELCRSNSVEVIEAGGPLDGDEEA